MKNKNQALYESIDWILFSFVCKVSNLHKIVFSNYTKMLHVLAPNSTLGPLLIFSKLTFNVG